MVDHALETRIEMPEALMSLSDQGVDIDSLQEALGKADRVHELHGAALQILDDEVYEQRIEDVPLDLGSWWGNRARHWTNSSRQKLSRLLCEIFGCRGATREPTV